MMLRALGVCTPQVCGRLPSCRSFYFFSLSAAKTHLVIKGSLPLPPNPRLRNFHGIKNLTVHANFSAKLKKRTFLTAACTARLQLPGAPRCSTEIESPRLFAPRRFLATKGEHADSMKAEGLQENRKRQQLLPGEELMLAHYGERAVCTPKRRVVYFDVEETEKRTRAIIKKNNFYGKILLVFLVAGGILMYISYAATDASSGLLRHLDGLLEIIYRLLPENFPDPEAAHRVVMWLAARGYLPVDLDRDDPALSVNVKGLTLHTPVGLAAGFDKHAEAPLGFCKMGFGFVEVGSVTPRPQEGNPKPRIFRLAKDLAVINRCGFNSHGLDAVEPRLQNVSKERWHDRLARRCVLGVNLGKNKETEHAEEDIREGVKRIGRFADYIVINLSSPNTKGLRDLQQREHLKSIINAAQTEIKKLETRANENRGKDKNEEEEEGQKPEDLTLKATNFFPTQTSKRPLLFVKIAPDLTDEEKQEIAQVALETGLDGLVVTNTTIQRPEGLESESKNETGGLSGRPLKAMARKCVSDMYRHTKGQVAIIASGGIETGLDAFECIKAGASAVEVYTAMIYRGPVVARRVKDELLGVLNQAGIANVQDAVGMDHRPPKKKRVRKPTFD